MIRSLQSFVGMVFDATVGQMVHAASAAPPPVDVSWSGPVGSYVGPDGLSGFDPAVGTAGEVRREEVRQDSDLGTDDVKLVEYAIVSIRRDHERILPGGSGEEMVRGPMTREGFTAWIVACYPRWREVPAEDRRYLRVHYRVLGRWPLKRPGRGREDAALEGIRDAVLGLPRLGPAHLVSFRPSAPPRPSPRPALPAAPGRPASSVVTWDGTGTPTQVGARGRVTLTKTWNGDGYDVTLEGRLAIHSRSFGHVRHGLPSGYLPAGADPRGYSCEVQRHAVWGDLSGVDNYGGRGVHVRNDSFPGYEGRATLWFPERDYNGDIDLRCVWRTREPLP
jgi:hypothetical protein